MKHFFFLILFSFVARAAYCQEQEVILMEDFDDNRNNWNLSSDENSGTEIKNGHYYFESKQKDKSWFRYNPAIPGIDGNKDFHIEWSVTQVRGSEDWGSGIICFLDDDGK